MYDFTTMVVMLCPKSFYKLFVIVGQLLSCYDEWLPKNIAPTVHTTVLHNGNWTIFAFRAAFSSGALAGDLVCSLCIGHQSKDAHGLM